MRRAACIIAAWTVRFLALPLVLLGAVAMLASSGLTMLADWIEKQGEPTCLYPPR